MGPAMDAPVLGQKSLSALLSAHGTVSTRTVGFGGRQTVDKIGPDIGTHEFAVRHDPAASWRTLETQRKNLLNLSPDRLTTIALDLSPPVSKGLWDFIRFGNPGHIVDVVDRNGERIPESYSILERFFDHLSENHGSVDALFDTMFSSFFVYGAIFLELVLARGARRAIDIAVNDPISAIFRRSTDADYGQRWLLCQQQGPGIDNCKVLQFNPCVKYLGLDALPGNPYGRPMITPSVYSSIFLLGLIQDLRRVVANQGLNRLDYSVSTEEMLKLIALAGTDIAGNDQKTAEFINRHLGKIKDELKQLDIDSNYVHLDTVSVNYAQGGANAQQMQGVETLVRLLERQITNGLKSINILMNSNEAVSETHANRQLDFYLGAVESNQNELAKVLRQFLTIALRVRGARGKVIFNYKKQRVADRKTIAETQRIQIDNVIAKRDAEFITLEQAQAEIKALVDPLEIQ